MNEAPDPSGPCGTAAASPAVVEPPWTEDELVDRLIDARRGGVGVPAERVASFVRTAEQAYVVQARLNDALWPQVEPAAWKIGADSRDSLPVAAPMMPALVFDNDTTLPATRFPVRIVEAEIAYRFGVDLPPRAVPYTTDEVADAVATMHVAIEVVTPRIADFAVATSFAKLADHGLNGAFVLGDGVKAWRRIDLRRQKAVLTIGGRIVEAVEGSHALGNPAVLLPWFVAFLGRQPTRDVDGHTAPPRGVRAGDVVTTGSWTKVVEARAGQRVEARFDGVGSAVLTFAN